MQTIHSPTYSDALRAVVNIGTNNRSIGIICPGVGVFIFNNRFVVKL